MGKIIGKMAGKKLWMACGFGAIVGAGICKGTKRKQEKARKDGKHVPYGPYEAFVKRPMDAALSVVALVALAPLLCIIALLVRLRLGSPVIFAQERPGRDGKIFTLYKFRTMTDARDGSGNLLADDERLPEFGRMLRSTSSDELPELLNIIRGEMSLIGPRPLLKEYLPYYSAGERHRQDVRPGLSGMAQVRGRNAISWEEKFAWDIQYVNKITFLGDMGLVLETIYKTLKRADIRMGGEHAAGRLDVARGRNGHVIEG